MLYGLHLQLLSLCYLIEAVQYKYTEYTVAAQK